MRDVEQLLMDGISALTGKQWMSDEQHIITEEDKISKLDDLEEDITEWVIINLEESDHKSEAFVAIF